MLLFKVYVLALREISPSKMDLDREMAYGLSCKCVFRSSSCREIYTNCKATVHPDFAAYLLCFPKCLSGSD